MFKNYLLITFRNFKRHKGYSFLNVLGLSLGIACCILIMLYIQFELSYDTYHKDVDRIFRVSTIRNTDSQSEIFATSAMGVTPILKENYPDVVEAARCGEASNYQVRYKDKHFIEENFAYADNALFNILEIPFLSGDSERALTRPNTVVITAEMSEKYFGAVNPVGEIILFDTTAYEVTGVIKNFPANTHQKRDFLICFITAEEQMREMGLGGVWGGYNCMNYIKLKENVDPEEFETKIKSLPSKYNAEELEKRGVESTLFLQHITDIHLYSNFNWEAEPPGNPLSLIIFSSIGIFILLLSSMNFMNLMTARSSNRSGEVGIRKVIGARRSQLISQFIGESLLTTLISVFLSVLLVGLILPYFNTLAGKHFIWKDLGKSEIIIGLLCITIFIGIAAGSYPAFLLSSFKPVTVLKRGLSQSNRGAFLRKFLVVAQFAISIMLIIGLLIFFQQLNFMKNNYLGFDKEQKLVIEFDRSIITPNSYESVKQEFLKHPSVISGTFSSSVPGRWMYFWHLRPFGDPTNDQMINCFQVDYDFLSEYNIEIIAGRAFQKEMGMDRPGCAWIVNEAAVNAFGWNNNGEALKNFIGAETDPIVGITKDFHLKGLQNSIEPLGMFLIVEDFRYLTLKINIEQTDDVIAFVKEKHADLFAGYLFDYFFLDEDFDLQYRTEEKTVSLFGMFTILGVIIAVLGLFGLASFLTQKRTKEIGIRKVLGASVIKVVIMLSKEFIGWVLIANIIAWPCAYFLVNHWLNDFAYRISIGIFPFVISAAVALFVAIITVSYQTIKAALANPVNSLKYE